MSASWQVSQCFKITVKAQSLWHASSFDDYLLYVAFLVQSHKEKKEHHINYTSGKNIKDSEWEAFQWSSTKMFSWTCWSEQQISNDKVKIQWKNWIRCKKVLRKCPCNYKCFAFFESFVSAASQIEKRSLQVQMWIVAALWKQWVQKKIGQASLMWWSFYWR